MTESNLKDNIKLIVIKLKLASGSSTDKALADAFGIDKNLFSSWKNQRKLIPIEYLVNFCNTYNVSLDWLLRDDGTLQTQESSKFLKIKYYEDRKKAALCGNSSSFIDIPKKIIPKNKSDSDIRAILSESNELSISAPAKNSVLLFDFGSTKISTSPNTFLIKSQDNYFIRNVYIAPNNKYLTSSENKSIAELYIDFEDIEIIATLIGVLKWENQ